MRRVAVTGVGAVSAAGVGVASFRQALLHGETAIRLLEGWPPRTFRFAQAAQAINFEPARHFEEKQAASLDRSTQMALVAAREAVADAGLGKEVARAAVVMGSSIGGQNSMDEAFIEMYKKGVPRVSPLMIPRVMANAGASHISMEFGAGGPAYTVSTACASSAHALGQAFWLVRSGAVDTAIAGGHEAVFSYGFLRAWEAMRVVSPDTCRPFCSDRNGMILGEGAGMLILEPLEAARARGRRIYAEITGFGMSADAHHITQPSPEGAARAICAALDDAAIAPEQVGYINAHGTGTTANDVSEAQAIRLALGDAAADAVRVSSTKSMHGHALGAAGALEALATVIALEGVLPATVNFTEQDPACNVQVISNQPLRAQVQHALSNSFAFGGLNAVLVFTHPDA